MLDRYHGRCANSGDLAASAIMVAYPLTEWRFPEIVRSMAARRLARRSGEATTPPAEATGPA